jgi:hypothetical protein
MVDTLALVGAGLLSVCGMAWFALAKAPHWEQARREPMPKTVKVRTLHGLGSAALALSLALCLVADHASMASLVWVMLLTASALVVTFTLSWRPRWLGWLVGWAS